MFSRRKRKLLAHLKELERIRFVPETDGDFEFLGYLHNGNVKIEYTVMSDIHADDDGISFSISSKSGDLGAFRIRGKKEVIFTGRANPEGHFTAICSAKVQGHGISLSQSYADTGYMILKDMDGDCLKRYYKTDF